MVLPCPRSRSSEATPINSASGSPRAERSDPTSSTDKVLPVRARARARRSCWGVVTWANLRPVTFARKQPSWPGHSCDTAVRDDAGVKIAALAGGVGAGKFLRGLVRVVPPEDLTVVVNTGDDILVHGLHVSPDLDSVTYWLAGVADRDRGWGRAGETFRSTEELRRLGVKGSWF